MAKSAYGATISVGGTALVEVTSLKIPDKNGEVIEVLTHGSTDRFVEYLRGSRSWGEGSVTMEYEAGNGTDDACNAAIDSDTATAIVLTAAAASGTEDFTFSAFGLTFSVDSLEPNGKQTSTFTFQPSGTGTQAPSA